MLKTELIQRSPIRVLEKSIHGGLKKGELGVFTARKGVGKTACLAHVALDDLLRGNNVLHISFADNPRHIETWYEHIFQEVASTYKLEHPSEIYEDILAHRLILHFQEKYKELEPVRQNIQAVTGGSHFTPGVMIVDGFSFYEAEPHIFQEWKQLANEMNTEVWFSATIKPDDTEVDEEGIPSPVSRFKHYFAVIIFLSPMNDFVDLQLLKDRDSKNLEKLRLKLDPKTLLIANRRV